MKAFKLKVLLPVSGEGFEEADGVLFFGDGPSLYAHDVTRRQTEALEAAADGKLLGYTEIRTRIEIDAERAVLTRLTLSQLIETLEAA